MSERVLCVDRLWNGSAAPAGLRAEVGITRAPDGDLALRARAWLPRPARVPEAAPGARVDGLWKFDVVECFLAGAAGRYLEVELGAGGHWLALSFSAPRVRADSHEGLALRVSHLTCPGGFESRVALPAGVLPVGLGAANAFAILGGHLLAHRPTPGPTPDFHQPASFPPLVLR